MCVSHSLPRPDPLVSVGCLFGSAELPTLLPKEGGAGLGFRLLMLAAIRSDARYPSVAVGSPTRPALINERAGRKLL
jgi:hypothetical protein